MKSIIIKDALTGQKLIKVSHTKKGYFVEALSTLDAFDCKIITSDNEWINIPIRPKR